MLCVVQLLCCSVSYVFFFFCLFFLLDNFQTNFTLLLFCFTFNISFCFSEIRLGTRYFFLSLFFQFLFCLVLFLTFFCSSTWIVSFLPQPSALHPSDKWWAGHNLQFLRKQIETVKDSFSEANCCSICLTLIILNKPQDESVCCGG